MGTGISIKPLAIIWHSWVQLISGLSVLEIISGDYDFCHLFENELGLEDADSVSFYVETLQLVHSGHPQYLTDAGNSSSSDFAYSGTERTLSLITIAIMVGLHQRPSTSFIWASICWGG